MIKRRTCGGLAAMLIASSAFATAAFADTMTMWVRASGTNAAAHLVDLWNATHADKIELTTIPDNQMVTKLATGVQAGEVPDLVSFDLIYMPDFMKAGFLTDLTADLKANPNYASVAQAYKDIATYEGKIYGAGFTPDVSILVWNKDLFKKAGPRSGQAAAHDRRDPRGREEDPRARPRHLRLLFLRRLPWLQHLHHLADDGRGGLEDPARQRQRRALTGDGVKEVLETFKAMWNEGLIPKSAQADNGANFSAVFKTGKIGIQGTGGFLISDLKTGRAEPELRRHLPAGREGRPGVVVRRRRRRRDPEGLEARRPRQGSSSPGS